MLQHNAVVSCQWSVVSRPWTGRVSGRCESRGRWPPAPAAPRPQSSVSNPPRSLIRNPSSAFTLIELLVMISIISILAALALGA